MFIILFMNKPMLSKESYTTVGCGHQKEGHQAQNESGRENRCVATTVVMSSYIHNYD